MKIVSIIVNWRLPAQTLACVRSLQKSTHPTEIVVVDNASGDGSEEFLRQNCPRVHLIVHESNLGFGPACNRAVDYAIAQLECDAIFLVNNDVTLAPNAIALLVAATEKHPSAGIFGAKVYYQDQPRRLWHAGARRRQGVLAATQTGRNEIDNGQFDDRGKVDYIFGAAMMICRKVIDDIGFFDERFFLYLEDLDYCIRAQKAGYELQFVPKALTWHEGSASTKKNLALRRYHMARSSILFLRKHASGLTGLAAFSFWVLVYIRDIIRDMLLYDRRVLIESAKGLRAGWRQAAPPVADSDRANYD